MPIHSLVQIFRRYIHRFCEASPDCLVNYQIWCAKCTSEACINVLCDALIFKASAATNCALLSVHDNLRSLSLFIAAEQSQRLGLHLNDGYDLEAHLWAVLSTVSVSDAIY